jgi:hypothetical protein
MVYNSVAVSEADIRAAEERYRQSARFLMDVNIPLKFGAFLSEQGWDTQFAREVLPLGSPDEEIIAYAIKTGRVVFTRDKKYTKLIPADHTGLVVLPSDPEFDYFSVLPHALRTLGVMTALRGSINGSTVVVRADGRVTRVSKEPSTGAIATVWFSSQVKSLASNAPDEDIARASLRTEWDKVMEIGLSPDEKGRRFEEFSAAFFSALFSVVETRLNTDNGELDLVLEMLELRPFWLKFGSDILVECKNWADPRPLKEAALTCYKASQSRAIKLAFLVSVSGFTKDALVTLRNNARNPDNPLVVPISGDEIKSVLSGTRTIEEFLKERIRRMELDAKLP